ncbi:MAG: T9SS type A sorting domain-containing protein [Melioribacteraceae bacterium]|nr:T9SS type A sorting domain-containing protein [Melioribacteraceae bacterium]
MRDLTNTGPFTLKKDEPMDIIVAYVVGKGTDALNSITRAREITQYVHEEYERNFSTVVCVDDKPEEVINRFSLSQNYPNPFNPSTRIEYQVSSIEKVSLKVYDILGREIKTFVNEVKSPGSYEVQFNASRLASGVYFYRLTTGDFVQTKKMMVIK